MSGMIEIEELSRHYQMGPTTVKAIDQIALSIDEGAFVSIVGPSGSGKTTLMNIIGCLDSPTNGRYLLDGQDVSNLSKSELAETRNRSIGFVFQSFNLLPRQSARENVELPMIYAGIAPKERRRRALDMLDRVHLADRSEHVPNELSGGQRQRVAIARALAGNPQLILADEPTGALDSKTGVEIIELFRELNASGVSLIMVTHDNELAAQADRVIQIKDGRVLWDGEAQRWMQ